jgi:ribosomal protein S18 acetylase RimI-like enzyme
MSEIVPFSLNRYPEILELWRSDTGIGLTRSDEPEELARFLERNPGLSHLALTDEGAVAGTILAGHDGRRGFIYHLFVIPGYRGQGLGRRLVDKSLEGLTALGIEKVHIMVFGSNSGGRAFWKKRGFSERGEISLMSRGLAGNDTGKACGC